MRRKRIKPEFVPPEPEVWPHCEPDYSRLSVVFQWKDGGGKVSLSIEEAKRLSLQLRRSIAWVEHTQRHRLDEEITTLKGEKENAIWDYFGGPAVGLSDVQPGDGRDEYALSLYEPD